MEQESQQPKKIRHDYTDTAAIQLSGKGVKTALLSIPCRYMHTPVEMCSLEDVEHAITLIVETIKAINKGNL